MFCYSVGWIDGDWQPRTHAEVLGQFALWGFRINLRLRKLLGLKRVWTTFSACRMLEPVLVTTLTASLSRLTNWPCRRNSVTSPVNRAGRSLLNTPLKRQRPAWWMLIFRWAERVRSACRSTAAGIRRWCDGHQCNSPQYGRDSAVGIAYWRSGNDSSCRRCDTASAWRGA